jgi:hypothetical protein
MSNIFENTGNKFHKESKEKNDPIKIKAQNFGLYLILTLKTIRLNATNK